MNLQDFAEVVVEYQTTPVGGYPNRSEVVDSYNRLSKSDKRSLQPPLWKIKNAYRGSDGIDEGSAFSFLYHKDPDIAKRNAKFYGRYTYPLSDFTYSGIIDTELLDGAGDDENELIVINMKYVGTMSESILPKVTALLESIILMIEYNENQFPKIFSILKQYKGDDIGVHFSHTEFVKMNPSPMHHDPLGVYSFPKSYVESDGLDNNFGFAKMPFAHILKIKDSASVLNLSTLDQTTTESIVVDMGIPVDYLTSEDTKHYSGDKWGHRLWGSMERWRSENNLSKNSSWNNLFKKVGYNVLRDDGDRIIHPNEPAQIAFLDPSTYEVLETIKGDSNNAISKFVEAFPDWRPKKETSTFANATNLTLYRKDGVSIVIGYTDDRYSVRIYGVVDEYFKSYRNTDSVDVAIESVRAALEGSEVKSYVKDRNTSSKISQKMINTIAETFNLKKPNKIQPEAINRVYGQGDRRVKFNINTTESEGKVYLSGYVERRRSYGFDNFYLYFSNFEIAEATIRDVVYKGLDAMLEQNESNVKREKDRGGIDYGAEDAEKFVRFMKGKVFK